MYKHPDKPRKNTLKADFTNVNNRKVTAHSGHRTLVKVFEWLRLFLINDMDDIVSKSVMFTKQLKYIKVKNDDKT